jgi:dTDP-glucose 4,6-dehydratase
VESRVIYFSTDEVYGPAPGEKAYVEGERYLPGNPYAASKAAAECFCYAFCNTYQMPITITNTMNVFGERQHPEKFIPMCIRKILRDETITIHSAPDKVTPGSRFYIHARNVADALLHLLKLPPMSLDNEDASYGKWNVVGPVEWDNLTLARMIAKILGKDLKYEMVDFHSSRPGHDLRYALSGAKLQQYGWEPPVSMDVSLEKTVAWTLENQRWLES